MNAPATVTEEQAMRAAEVAAFKSEFLRYAAMEDLNQPCPIGRLTKDSYLESDKRRQTIAEVIFDALDDRDYVARMVSALCKLAKGFSPCKEAHDLLTEAAASWADARVDV